MYYSQRLIYKVIALFVLFEELHSVIYLIFSMLEPIFLQILNILLVEIDFIIPIYFLTALN